MPILWFFALIMNAVLCIKLYQRIKTADTYVKPMFGMASALTGWVLFELMMKVVVVGNVVLFLHEAKYVFILGAPVMFLIFIQNYVGKKMSVDFLIFSGDFQLQGLF